MSAFNGTTVTFATTPMTNVLSVESEVTGEVDVTASDDTTHLYEGAIPEKTTTVEVRGTTALTIAATGALAVAWFGTGSDGSITKAVITDIRPTGSLDNPISTTIVFKPTP